MKQESKGPNMVISLIVLIGGFVGGLIGIELSNIIKESLLIKIMVIVCSTYVGAILAITLFYYIALLIIKKRRSI